MVRASNTASSELPNSDEMLRTLLKETKQFFKCVENILLLHLPRKVEIVFPGHTMYLSSISHCPNKILERL